MSIEPNAKVWFVTGSQHLYGEKVLNQVNVNSQEIALGLSNSEHISTEVVFKPTVTTPSEITRMCQEANMDDSCIGIIFWMHTFSPSKMWIDGLLKLQKPWMHLHTQFNVELPWHEIDMNFMNLNQSAHGCREFGFIGTRLGIDRHVVAGHWQTAKVQQRVGTWVRVATAWSACQTLKVARFGDNMRQVAVTEGNKVSAQIQFGYEVHAYSLGALT
ncbi:MAG: L-arabinose isomerase, partial [Reinekea forsetii]|nr:L-arabinose isomerase [Reinekea forsetii]